MEQRRHFRIDLDVTSYCKLTGGVVLRSRIVNISRGGVLVEVVGAPPSWLPAVGGYSNVAFDLPQHPTVGPRSLVCVGRIVRSTVVPGAAQRFAVRVTKMFIRADTAVGCLTGTQDAVQPVADAPTTEAQERDEFFECFSDCTGTTSTRPS